jgi:general nucleoside transport system permease protein
LSEQEPVSPEPVIPPEGEGVPSVAERFVVYQRLGGIATPLLTMLVAFFIGGLVVLFTTHKNPLNTYREIFEGTGLTWFFHVGSNDISLPFSDTRVWFPWDTGSIAAQNLQQTLIYVVVLILTGLAVAFAFRCGLFNIGGQGQYIVGMLAAAEVGIYFADMPKLPHVVLAVTAAALAGAAWGGIAGFLKATVGAHEVITTIMLNWIAIWVVSWLVGVGGPLQDPNPNLQSVATTQSVSESSKLPVFWGPPTLQGLHIGLFIAFAALAVYWVVLNRTTLGYEVRAVGFNPEAARYGGIGVSRNYFLAMAISGLFAGLAGSMDVLGWLFKVDETSVTIASQVAFLGIAVALLGRNSAIGIFFASILFGALLTGTSTRNLDPAVFKPELAGNLTRIIQGLVVLFVGADLLILYIWHLRRKLRMPRKAATEA